MKTDPAQPQPTPLQQELGKRRPFEVPEQEAYLNLVRTHGHLSAAFDRLFEAHGLSPSGFNILRILRGARDAGIEHGRPCHEIGEQMVARVPDVTRLVDRLEKAGLVVRHRCTKDRRVVYVAITEAGLGLLARLDEPTLELHRAQLGHLSREELAELSRLLARARAGPAGAAGAGEERRPGEPERGSTVH